MTAVMSSFIKGSMASPAPKEKKMQRILTARCRRLAGQSTVVGTTVISYDKDGTCRLIDHANVSADFEVHCRQNGVERLPDLFLTEEGETPPAPAPLPPAPVKAADVAPPGAELPPAPEAAPAMEAVQEEPAAPAVATVPVEDPVVGDQASAVDDSTKKKSKRR